MTLREDAEKLRAELDGELEPETYRRAWEKGSGEEVEDVVERILMQVVS